MRDRVAVKVVTDESQARLIPIARRKMLRPSLLANYNKLQQGTSTAEEPSKPATRRQHR
ncbi:MAG TPA: hypothetical protein VF906_02550 [Candidatus Bathyarchaeia archaeon]